MLNTENYTKFWAVKFTRCGGKSGNFHNHKPIYGIRENDYFIPYKTKNGKPTEELSSKKIYVYDGYSFFNTYEEAIQFYNNRINDEIKFYEHKIEQLKSFLK